MSETVTIGGRAFRVGAWYGPKRGKGKAKPRRFMGVVEVTWAPGVDKGVIYRDASPYRTGILVPTWLRWAGEEVPDA